jgi:hypothetical protein
LPVRLWALALADQHPCCLEARCCLLRRGSFLLQMANSTLSLILREITRHEYMTARSTARGATTLCHRCWDQLQRHTSHISVFWRDIQFLIGQALDVMWKKIPKKAVFLEKITGKKGAFFCRRIFRQNVFYHFL